MLRVTVELVPFGFESEKHRIGAIELVNDGTGDRRRGNYDVRVVDNGVEKTGRVENFPRAAGWTGLVAAALEEVGV